MLKVLVLDLHLLEFFSCKVSVRDCDSLEAAKGFLLALIILCFSVTGHDQIILDNLFEIILAFLASAIEWYRLSCAVHFVGA